MEKRNNKKLYNIKQGISLWVTYNPEYKNQECSWLDKNGKWWGFPEMSDQHLKATIRLLLYSNYVVKNGWRYYHIQPLLAEMLRRMGKNYNLAHKIQFNL